MNESVLTYVGGWFQVYMSYENLSEAQTTEEVIGLLQLSFLSFAGAAFANEQLFVQGFLGRGGSCKALGGAVLLSKRL